MPFNLKYLKSLIHSDRFLRNTLALAWGTGAGQAIVLITAPILTRLYTPSEFGVLSVVTSSVAIISVLSSLRYENAIPLPDDEESARAVLILSILIATITSSIVGIGLFFLPTLLGNDLTLPYSFHLTWLIPLALFGTSTYRAFCYWAIRNSEFTVMSKTRIIRSLWMVGTQIILGFYHWSTMGLLIGFVLGQLTGFTSLMRNHSKETIFKSRVDKNVLIKIARRYKKFALLSCPAALLNNSGTNILPILFAAFFGAHIAGGIDLAQRIFGIPMQLAANSASQVFMSELAACRSQRPGSTASALELFWKTIRTQAVLGVPAVIAAIPGPWLIPIIFGPEWIDSGIFLTILSLHFYARFIVSPTNGTLEILERQGLHMIREIVRVVLLSAAVFTAWIGDYSPLLAVILYSAAGFIFNIQSLVLHWRVIRFYENSENAR